PKQLPGARLVEITSTAAAAQVAVDKPGAAAVASRQAASRYGLRLLFSDIEDYPDNETRFAVIGRHKCSKGSHDKTSLVFRIAHAPGALVEALDLFRQSKINLTWIESFPARAGRAEKPEYLFFVDIEGHQEDPKVAKVIKALSATCRHLRVLGSYPVAPMPH
ncbi:MAG: prephenate dehydratase, partial [Planctomycetota bacterium]